MFGGHARPTTLCLLPPSLLPPGPDHPVLLASLLGPPSSRFLWSSLPSPFSSWSSYLPSFLLALLLPTRPLGPPAPQLSPLLVLPALPRDQGPPAPLALPPSWSSYLLLFLVTKVLPLASSPALPPAPPALHSPRLLVLTHSSPPSCTRDETIIFPLVCVCVIIVINGLLD